MCRRESSFSSISQDELEQISKNKDKTKLIIMSPTLVAALLLLALFSILYERKKRSISQKVTLPPSPRGLPFIGNLLQLGVLPHRSLCHLSKKHGPLMLLRLGSIPTVVVSSPNFAQEFLSNHDIVFASRPSLKASRVLFYNDIDVGFSPYGECWRQMKKICMMHLLSQKMVQSFSYVRTEEMAQLLKRISAHSGSGVCITKMLNELANNMVCRAVLGSSLNDGRMKLVCKLVHNNSIMLTTVFAEDYFPRFRWVDKILGLEGRLRSHFEIWDSLLEELIEDRLIKKPKNQSDSVDFLGVLLQLQENSGSEFVLTKEHIKALLMDMIVAGTDTSFVTLDWSMAELIRNPRVMKKVQEEVRLIANGKDMVKDELLHKMTYLQAVIKEVLRLHPPAPLLLPRESTHDCQMQGYHIPKQTRVIINAWAIGRDKASWEAPEEFLPERFLDKNMDFMGREFHFIPFGAGRRMCPGISFAIAIVEHALANLLLLFEWKLPNGFSFEDIDLEESPGIVSSRKHKLELVPILVKKVNLLKTD